MKRCTRCNHFYTFEPCPFCTAKARRSSDDTATMPAIAVPDFTSPAVDTGSAPDTSSSSDFSGGGGEGGGGGASSDF